MDSSVFFTKQVERVLPEFIEELSPKRGLRLLIDLMDFGGAVLSPDSNVFKTVRISGGTYCFDIESISRFENSTTKCLINNTMEIIIDRFFIKKYENEYCIYITTKPDVPVFKKLDSIKPDSQEVGSPETYYLKDGIKYSLEDLNKELMLSEVAIVDPSYDDEQPETYGFKTRIRFLSPFHFLIMAKGSIFDRYDIYRFLIEGEAFKNGAPSFFTSLEAILRKQEEHYDGIEISSKDRLLINKAVSSNLTLTNEEKIGSTPL